MDQKENKKKLISISLLISFLFTSTYILSFLNWPNIPEYKFIFILNIFFSTSVYFIFIYLFLHYFYLKKKISFFYHSFGLLVHYIFYKIIILIYGIQSLKLFFESLQINFNTFNKIVFIIIIIISYWFFYKFFFKNFKNYLRFICTFSIITLVYCSFFIIQTNKLTSLNYNNLSEVKNPKIKSSSERKVNFIIFDEADYELLELNKYRLKLNNYIKFQNKSLDFTNAYSPGRDTAKSVPSLLMGVEGEADFKFDRKKIYLQKNNDNKKITFEFKNTIFNLAKEKDAVSIVAGADRKIIYCEYLKIKNCHDIASEMDFRLINFDGFEAIISIINNIFKPYMFDNERQKTDTFLIQFLAKKNSAEKNLRNNIKIDNLSFESLKRDDIEIAYIHYPYPHYPSNFADYLFTFENNLDWYEKNLILLDRTLGKIMEILNESKTSMTIITSDHGLRSLDLNQENIRRVPFIVNFNNTSEKNIIYDKFYTFNSKKIIKKYLNNEINNYSDLIKLVSSLKSVE